MKNTYSVLQGAPGLCRLHHFSSLKGAQSHYRRQLQEYSVITTDRKTQYQGPRWKVLGRSVLLPHQLCSPWYMGKMAGERQRHWATSEALGSRCLCSGTVTPSCGIQGCCPHLPGAHHRPVRTPFIASHLVDPRCWPDDKNAL